jgi:glycosyltransferase involved in cell wall biosynthesis/SAM-dependent methyltransferase
LSQLANSKTHSPGDLRVGVLVVAYNAATTLTAVLDRLPESFRETVDHILVCDDASSDTTFQVGQAYRDGSTLPLTVVRHAENLGYGGNQKSGYQWAIAHGLDAIVLLHGDGQYAPEVIEELVAPISAGLADAVLGSRMMLPGSARAGGMPLYKFVGNRVLTRLQNALTGRHLSEWHSGYRAYRVESLASIPFEQYSDGFDFDTEIILGLHSAAKRIVEVPIPTYYGDEICHVNGLRYAKDVLVDVVHHRLRDIGFGDATVTPEADAYQLKHSPHSSHGKLLSWLAELPTTKVLDVGCSAGEFGELVRLQGHQVIGVDLIKQTGVGERLDGFVEADLNDGLPDEVGGDYGVIVAGDVLEHVIDPAALLGDMKSRVAANGSILVSIPNFGHWYPRTRVTIGRFDYDARGPLDRGHVRFFTRRSFEKLVASGGLRIRRRDVVGSPFELIGGGGNSMTGRLAMRLASVDRLFTRLWPTLFGYQFVYELVPD